jgi:hypothetical protein
LHTDFHLSGSLFEIEKQNHTTQKASHHYKALMFFQSCRAISALMFFFSIKEWYECMFCNTNNTKQRGSFLPEETKITAWIWTGGLPSPMYFRMLDLYDVSQRVLQHNTKPHFS